jgi:hypothetical protein
MRQQSLGFRLVNLTQHYNKSFARDVGCMPEIEK